MSRYLIDADQHTVEPRDLWERWLPKKFMDLAPKVVRDPEGGDAWSYEPGRYASMGIVCHMGESLDAIRHNGLRYGESIPPAVYDGEARLKAMDQDHITASVQFTPMRALLYWMNMRAKEPEAALAGVRAYNDFLLDGFCAANPKRLVGVAQIPDTGIGDAIAELHRTKERGGRGMVLKTWPSGADRICDEDDKFWGVAEEMGMVICIHVGLKTGQNAALTAVPAKDGDASKTAGAKQMGALAWHGITFFTSFPDPMLQVIFSGVHDRFPRLKFVGAEVGVGWVPHVLDLADDRFERNRKWMDSKLEQWPSEYFRQHWLLTFMRDRIGVKLRHEVGIRNMAWSSDFPHHGNDWPNSRRVSSTLLAGLDVTEEERERLLWKNAAETWGLEL